MAAFCAVIPKAAHHDVIHQGWVEAGLAADELGYEQFRKMAEKCTFYRSVQDETVLRYWWRSVELLAPTFWENSELKEVPRGQGGGLGVQRVGQEGGWAHCTHRQSTTPTLSSSWHSPAPLLPRHTW